MRGWTSAASGKRNHGWNRDRKPVDPGPPKRWRWRCRDCGSLLEKSDVNSGYPTYQEQINAGIDTDCAVQAAKMVMES